MAANAMHRTSSHGTGKKAEMLYAARLLSGADRQYSLEENHGLALSCYDLLIDTIQNPAVARELSMFTHMPPNEIQASAETIIDRFLFNRENNPYTTLGFQSHAPNTEVAKRWKRLITLYHPDKYPNQNKYEERAKRINQAYAEIRRMKEEERCCEILRDVRKYHSPGNDGIYLLRYMRRLPSVIIATAIIMAIISMLLFISMIIRRHSVAHPRSGIKISTNDGWLISLSNHSFSQESLRGLPTNDQYKRFMQMRLVPASHTKDPCSLGTSR